MKTYVGTDIGKRETNQDIASILQIKENEIFMIVCDGMGGHNSGDVASKMVLHYLEDAYKAMPRFSDSDEAKEWLIKSILGAHRSTKRFSYTSYQHAGMGTTLVCCLILKEEYLICSIGDSRAYFIDHDIHLLTEDDTFVNELVKSGIITKEQASVHEKRNVLMKALGVSEEIDPEVTIHKLEEGYILLCTDGLYNAVSELQIKQMLHTVSSLKEKGDAMLYLANRQGGQDNITVAITLVEKEVYDERDDNFKTL